MNKRKKRKRERKPRHRIHRQNQLLGRSACNFRRRRGSYLRQKIIWNLMKIRSILTNNTNTTPTPPTTNFCSEPSLFSRSLSPQKKNIQKEALLFFCKKTGKTYPYTHIHTHTHTNFHLSRGNQKWSKWRHKLPN